MNQPDGKVKLKVKKVGCSDVSDSVTPWTVTHQVPLSMEFSRPEYWSGLPFPPPGNLPDPGIEPRSPALQADSFSFEPPGKPLELLTTLRKKKRNLDD